MKYTKEHIEEMREKLMEDVGKGFALATDKEVVHHFKIQYKDLMAEAKRLYGKDLFYS